MRKSKDRHPMPDVHHLMDALSRSDDPGRFRLTVAATLQQVMQVRKLHLLPCKPSSPEVTLWGRHCHLWLCRFRDGSVACNLVNPDDGANYELFPYLYLVQGEHMRRYLPCYRVPCSTGQEPCDLEAIAAALLSVSLNGPFSGDFSWSRDYRLLVEEACNICDLLWPLDGILSRSLNRWRGKLHRGDMTWIADGRAILDAAILPTVDDCYGKP